MQWNWQLSDWPKWRFDPKAMQSLERQFLLKSGQLLGAWQHLNPAEKDQAKIDLLSAEAVTTSAIEGEILDRDSVRSSLKRRFGLKAPERGNAAERGMASLMGDVFEQFDTPLSHELICAWHSLICAGRRDVVVGGYREHETPMQVVSGPIGKEKVHFEAPPSAQMQAEMEAFLVWYASTKESAANALPAITRAALTHLYFVTIHPFEDGNGRMARALTEKALADTLGQPSLIALSTEIEQHRKPYYAALEHSNRSLDCTEWLVYFGETILEAQKTSEKMVATLIAKTKLFDRLRDSLNPRQERVLLRLFDAEPQGFKGGLSAKNYMTITKASPATARRDLSDLVTKQALHRTGEKKTTRYWLQLDENFD